MIPAFAKVALQSPTSWRHGVYRLGLFGVTLWLLVRALTALWQFTIDDSGISYAYAKHLAMGLGPVAAPGAPWVEGYSNALWVFVLVPFQWLSLPMAEVSKWLGVVCFASTLATGVWLLVKEYGARLGTGALAFGWMALLGFCVEVVVWVVAGLENALLGALLLGLVAAERAERQRPTPVVWSSLLAFGVCITRPEGILYVAPILTLQFWDAYQGQRSWRAVLRAALWFVGPLALYHAVHLAVFHEWVPNTYYAKPQERSLGRGFDYLRKGVRSTGLGYLLPLAVLGCVRHVRNKLPLIWYCVAGVTFIVYSGGDWMPYARFVSYFAPPLVLLAVHGVANLGALLALATERWFPRFRELGLEVTALLSVSFAVFFWHGHHAPRFAKEAKSKFCHFCQRTADAVKLQKVSKDAGLGRVTVLTHDFGGPSWQADERYYPIDFLGLCDASVARIRREQDRMWANTLLSPYLFHEQPHAPSWIYLPKNFWKALKDLPEYRSGYYTVSSRLLPHAPGGSYLALQRSHLVDYFPPIDASVKPVPLSSALGLFGVGWFAESGATARLTSGSSVRIVASIVPRETLRGNESVWVELSGAGKSVRSEKVALARGIAGLGPQLVVGEPLRIEVVLKLPQLKSESTSRVKLAIGVSGAKRGAKDTVVELAALEVGRELPVYERVASRFPSGLPVAEHPELVAQQRRVATAIERQHLGAKWLPTSEDVELATELRRIGDSLLAAAPRQAYLAYVWATQLDARQWEDLAKPLLALRQPIDDANLGNELALLRDYYTSFFRAPRAPAAGVTLLPGAAAALAEPVRSGAAAIPTAPAAEAAAPSEPAPSEPAPDAALSAAADAGVNLVRSPATRLVAFYSSTHDAPKADYFARQAGDVNVANRSDSWSWSQPFEDEKALDWEGDRGVFAIENPDVTGRKKRRGLVGNGYLTSRGKGDKAKGTLTSPMFTLSGPRLSFLLGGGLAKTEVGVELLIDGAVVLSASGGTQTVLQPVWWDVEPWLGKPARLRLFDKSSRQSVFLDQVLLWN